MTHLKYMFKSTVVQDCKTSPLASLSWMRSKLEKIVLPANAAPMLCQRFHQKGEFKMSCLRRQTFLPDQRAEMKGLTIHVLRIFIHIS